MWTDNETKTDLIGFKVHADLILNVVTDQSILPTVLGVFGDWGGGKSSIMMMIQEDLKHQDYEKVVCLYFNGWMFEGYEDAKTALLSSILMQLSEHERFGEKVKDKAMDLLKRVNYMEFLKSGGKGLLRYGLPFLISYISGGVIPPVIIPKGLSTGEAMEAPPSAEGEEGHKGAENHENKSEDKLVNWTKLIKDSKTESEISELRKFREDFEGMLKETDIESLVILIDDLDRCLPDRIIETLEAIKLFVLVPQTAFVIGADPRIVRHAIASRYVTSRRGNLPETEIEAEELVKDYLEKLIQIPYHLPRLSPSEIETYINLLACQKFLTPETNALVLDDWATNRSKNYYSPYQLDSIRKIVGELDKELDAQLQWSGTIAQVVTEGLKGNPRQVKRMLNALLLRKKLADVAGIEIKDDVLAKLMVLEYGHLARFYEVNDWQAAEEGFPHKLKKLEVNAKQEEGAEPIALEDKLADWDSPQLLRWLLMDPPLIDVDLRDYFWLARDRTSSTLAGVSMVSPVVRKILNSFLEGNEGDMEVAAKSVATIDNPDRDALIGLLQQQILKHPEQLKAYDALIKLSQNSVEGAGYALLKTIDEVSAETLPPALAPKIEVVAKSDNDLVEVARTLIAKLSGADKTRIGKAASLVKI